MTSLSKVLIPIAVMFLALSGASGQPTLKRTKVTKDISMKIPESFITMTQGERYDKYVSSRVPIAMYTSTDRLIDLGINVNSSPWASNEYEILQDFYKANILNLFDEVQFIQENIQDIGGRNFVVYEFVSTISDEDRTVGNARSVSKYTYILYTVYNNQVLLFNFSCPARLKNEWENIAHEIMASIRIK